MHIKTTIATIATTLFLGLTSAQAFGFDGLGGNGFFPGSSTDEELITVREINATSIEEGVGKILQSVRAFGMNEYKKQVEEGVEQPWFWLAKPLNKKADNMVDMFAPSFTKGVDMGGCFEKYFHIHMQDGESVEDAMKHAKEDIPDCMKNNEHPEGEFASNVRQMVLCQPKHGQLLLEESEGLHFAAAMPCHLSVYQKDGKVYVAWRNVEKMAEEAKLDDDSQDLAKEVQEAMEEMLTDL
jgi:hypothetical protein